MDIGGMRYYPKQIVFGSHIWDIKFTNSLKRRLGASDFHGWCDEENSTIWILKGLSPLETFITFLHEVMHCWESEGDFEIDHDSIFKIEKWMARFLIDNCDDVAGIVCSSQNKKRKTA